MYNSDIDTTQKMRKLEKELKQLYSDAYARLTAESERYFDEFEDRYEKQYEAYRQGKYTKQEFDAWYMNQVARGERWESLRDDMARKITNANVEAARLINGVTPEVFLTNYNWSAYEAEKASGIAFNIYNQSTVEELLKDEPELLPKKGINIPKDVEWNKKKLSNAVISGILTGKGINQISTSFHQVTDMNWAAAVRNARTAVTCAQNAGRQKNMEDIEPFLESKGMKLQKEWVAYIDGRTRDSHIELNGVRVDIREKFPNGLMHPGEKNGAPAEVYNCRCAECSVIDGITEKRTDKTKESYQKWVMEKEEQQQKRYAAQIGEKEKAGAGITSVDLDYISSQSYKDKIQALVGSEEEANSIYKSANKILSHRNGTHYEDLAFYDTKSKQYKINMNYDSYENGISSCKPSKAMEKMLKKAEENTIIAVHNHPTSSRPSIGDLMTCKKRKYKYGVVLAHDGTIYKYSVSSEFIPTNTVTTSIDKLHRSLYNGDVIRRKRALDELSQLGVDIEVM